MQLARVPQLAETKQVCKMLKFARFLYLQGMRQVEHTSLSIDEQRDGQMS